MALSADTMAIITELVVGTAKTWYKTTHVFAKPLPGLRFTDTAQPPLKSQDNATITSPQPLSTFTCIKSVNTTCGFITSAAVNRTLAAVQAATGDYADTINALLHGAIMEGAALTLASICVVMGVYKLMVTKNGAYDWSWIKSGGRPPNLSVRTVSLLVSACAMLIAASVNASGLSGLDAPLNPDWVIVGYWAGIIQLVSDVRRVRIFDGRYPKASGPYAEKSTRIPDTKTSRLVCRFSQTCLTQRMRKLYQYGWSGFATVWTIVLIVVGMIHLESNRHNPDKEALLSLFYVNWFLILCLYYSLTYVVLGMYSFSLKLWKLDKEISNQSNMDHNSNETFSGLVLVNTLLTPAMVVAAIIDTVVTLLTP
ncbi:hypothetical protein HK104_010532, partial [Borealophlyctis nickersoniae]